MEININRKKILESIGYKLGSLFKDIPVYINTSNNVKLPCFFVQFMPSSSEYLKNESYKDYYTYNIDIDIIYLFDENNTNNYINVNDVLDILDLEFVNLSIIDDDNAEEKITLKVHNKKNTIALDNLHFQFSLIYRVKLNDKKYNKLQSIKMEVQIGKQQEKKGYKIFCKSTKRDS